MKVDPPGDRLVEEDAGGVCRLNPRTMTKTRAFRGHPVAASITSPTQPK
jgi:hypothetical protein